MNLDIDTYNSLLTYIILFLDVLFGLLIAFIVNNFIESISMKKKIRTVLIELLQKMENDTILLTQCIKDLSKKEQLFNSVFLNKEFNTLESKNILIIKNIIFNFESISIRKSQFHGFNKILSLYDIKEYRHLLKIIEMYDFHTMKIQEISLRIDNIIENNIIKYSTNSNKLTTKEDSMSFLEINLKQKDAAFINNLEIMSNIIFVKYQNTLKSFLLEIRKLLQD